jgi:group II intron reverse transcriptase/maturase
MTHDGRKSDAKVVPAKRANKGVPTPAELVEGSAAAEGNPGKQTTPRAQHRAGVQHALDRVRLRAKADKGLRFTSLMHHIYALPTLRTAYYALKKDAASGIDRVTWRAYEAELEGNLQDLAERLRLGAYRAKPVRRVFIPKADGRQRPLGVPVLEDKVVQRATVEVLNAVYETDFIGFSYGYRPGKSQHHALDALYVGLLTKKVNWVLDGDIRSFFDRLDHEWLMRFLEHRIADRRVLRLIRKWLKAGVLAGGKWESSEEGTPQGGSASPLLANVFLHYVFDLWVNAWRKDRGNGDVIVVRYADDFVVGLESRKDAHRFREELAARFARFGLELHPEKTRLMEFGPWAARNRRRRDERKPETFNFLGFTHICGRKHGNGMFTVMRKTVRQKMTAKLEELKAELRRRMHQPVAEQGKWLKAVILGYDRYYGVPGNWSALLRFRWALTRLWWQTLRRRGNRRKLTWAHMQRLVDLWFPMIRIHHPYPLRRMGVIT